MTPNTRKPDESLAIYKARCKRETKALKLRLRSGKLLWDSQLRGTRIGSFSH